MSNTTCPTCRGTGHYVPKVGRPRTVVTFAGIDMTQPVEEIAAILHVSPQTVRKNWPAGVPRPTPRPHPDRRSEYDKVDWEKETINDVAARLGVSRQRAWQRKQRWLKQKARTHTTKR